MRYHLLKLAGGWILALLLALLAACASPPAAPGATPAASAPRPFARQLTQVSWRQIDGWQDDTLIGATTALQENCRRIGQRPEWRHICAAAAQLDALAPASARAFFERYFTPFQLANRDGTVDGLITGYYEPLLRGSRVRRAPYLYPIYRWPSGYRARATLPARATLLANGMLKGSELVYIDDPVEVFFLQVQGSGRIRLDDGSLIRVGYGGTNGKPYRSIGRWLLEQRELAPAQVTMQGIKAWAHANPTRVEALFNINPRFVFFKEAPATARGRASASRANGPLGALGAPLTPGRSIAVDPSAVPLGLPVFLSTSHPQSGAPLKRLVFAQDTGSAIKGVVRADYFWGLGEKAGALAGKMKARGRMWLLLPNANR